MSKGVKSIAQGHTTARYGINSPGLRAEYVPAWSPNVSLCHEYECTFEKSIENMCVSGEGGPGSKQQGTAVLAGAGENVIEHSFDSGKQHVGVC